MTTSRLTLPSSPSSFWRNTKCMLSPPPTVLSWFGTLWLLPIYKNEIVAERTLFWYHWDPGRIAESAWHWQKRTSRKRFKNGGDGGIGVYMREGTTSRMMAADGPYGEFYDFYSVSPKYFGYTFVRLIFEIMQTVYIYIYNEYALRAA
jgi:hypothetical protein